VQLSVPVFGVLLGALILDEPVTAYSLAAGAVTLAGVALVSIKTRR